MSINPYKYDYYAILGVPRTASRDEIKDAYKKYMKVNHPDLSDADAEEMVKLYNEAYSVLSDEHKKKDYDAFWDINFAKKKSTPRLKDYYNALNVKRTATPEEIKSAYLDVCERFGHDESEMAKKVLSLAKEAFQVLFDQKTREDYNTHYDKIHGPVRPSIGSTYSIIGGERTVVEPKKEIITVQDKASATTQLTGTSIYSHVGGEVTVVNPTREIYNPPKEETQLNVKPRSTEEILAGSYHMGRGEVTIVGQRREEKIEPVKKVEYSLQRKETAPETKTEMPLVQIVTGTTPSVFHRQENDALISSLNQEFEEMVSSFGRPTTVNTTGYKKIKMNRLYGLLAEDGSFQFVTEKTDAIFGFYWLETVPGKIRLTGNCYYKEIFWHTEGITAINGLRSVLIPAVKLLPMEYIQMGTGNDYIFYSDLQKAHAIILRALNSNPTIFERYFGQGKAY